VSFRPGHDVKLTATQLHTIMFESILAAVLPVIKDLLWTAAAALLAYALNKLQSHFQHI
jgi:uncharacterized protein (DUF2267 family)